MENNKKVKEKLIEILNKNPIMQPACDRCGISRATFYRWKSGDQKFAEKVKKIMANQERMGEDTDDGWDDDSGAVMVD